MRIVTSLAALLAALPAWGRDLTIVTDIPPVHSLTAMLMQDVGEPVLLLGQGADPHHFQLRPSQARDLAGADLVVWVGPDLTPWLDRALDGAGANTRRLTLQGNEGHDEHDDHDEHADHDDHHDHGEEMHQWLDPAIALEWLPLIATELVHIDPANAEIYQANLAQAQRRVIETTVATRILLEPAQDTPLVMAHNAYDSFAHAFGLTILGNVADGDAAAPGAGHLSGLRQTVLANPGACVFPEAGEDPAYLLTLTEGSEARLGGPLDPAGTALTPGPDLYDALLTGLAETIHDCATHTAKD